MRRRSLGLGFLAFVLVLPAIAVAKPVVTLKLSGAVLAKAADGHVTRTPVEKVVLKPGDDVEYEIVAANTGDSPALHLVPVGKIPAGTRYVDGSAVAPRAHVEFTLDGKSWSAQPTVTVKGPNGTPVLKKADASLYTAVRFVSDDALAAHKTIAFRYDVKVK